MNDNSSDSGACEECVYQTYFVSDSRPILGLPTLGESKKIYSPVVFEREQLNATGPCSELRI